MKIIKGTSILIILICIVTGLALTISFSSHKKQPPKQDANAIEYVMPLSSDYTGTRQLVISSRFAQDGVQDSSSQPFRYRITGKYEELFIDFVVVVIGNGSAIINGMLETEYTVTELTDSSWRFSPDKTTQKVSLVSGNSSVVFVHELVNDSWLNETLYSGG